MTDRLEVRAQLRQLANENLDHEIAASLRDAMETAERLVGESETLVLITDALVGPSFCLVMLTDVRVIVISEEGALVDMVWRRHLQSIMVTRPVDDRGLFGIRLFHVGGALMLDDVGDEEWANIIAFDLTDPDKWAALRLDEPEQVFETPPAPPTAEERWASVDDPQTAFVCLMCASEFTEAYRGGSCPDCRGFVVDRAGRIQ